MTKQTMTSTGGTARCVGGARTGRVVVSASRMSWLVDAAKHAASKAEAALHKLDKDGGEVVNNFAKRDLLAQHAEQPASASPPQARVRHADPRVVPPPIESVPSQTAVLRSHTAVPPMPSTTAEVPRTTKTKTAVDDRNDRNAKPVTEKARLALRDADSLRDVDAAQVSRRKARRVSLLDHVAALIAQRNLETETATKDANEARLRCAASSASTSKARDAAADQADAFAEVRVARFPNPASLFAHTRLTLFFLNQTLRSIRAQRAAAQDSADARLATLVGVGGERARKLALEERALALATRRRDDAARAVAVAERAVESFRSRGLLDIQNVFGESHESVNDSDAEAVHQAETVSLEASLRTTRADAEACRKRLADGEMLRSGEVSPKSTTNDTPLRQQLRRTAELLIQTQATCESLKSDKAALSFRLESARREILEKHGMTGLAEPSNANGESCSDTETCSDDDEETANSTTKYSNASSKWKRTPKHLAYVAASVVFGTKRDALAREFSEAVNAVDQLSLVGLTVWGKTRVARVGFAAYATVMHVYVFALLAFGGGGPRATNTETATSFG